MVTQHKAYDKTSREAAYHRRRQLVVDARIAPSLWVCYNPSMRCLITGGAGFIGTALANYLVGIGHYARVLDDLSAGDPSRLDFACAVYTWGCA